MNNHRQKVCAILPDNNGHARMLFGLFAAERLRGCCWCAKGLDIAWETYSEVLDDAFKAIAKQAPLNLEVVNRWKELIEADIPGGGEPLQVQGQSAFVCLLEALCLFRHHEVASAEAVINAVIDALDNYTFFLQRWILGDTSSPEEYPLLNREMRRQLSDADFVRNYDLLTTDQIMRRRIENLQYAVPAAVGGSATEF